MKFMILLSLPFISILGFFLKPDTSAKEQFSVNAAHELTDLKSIKYAQNLTDWRGRPVDSLVLDLYYPTGATSKKKYPLIVFCHGGGFSAGNRWNVMAIADRLADEGFVVAAFDYRVGYNRGNGNCTADSLGLVNAVYRAMQDCNACLRFLNANGDKYNIDTSNMFLGGTSAGASLAINDAYTNDDIAETYWPAQYQQLGKLQSTGNNYPANYKIKGLISMWGAMMTDPNQVINNDLYPTIMFKGDEDGGIPDSVGHFSDCPNYPLMYAGVSIYNRLVEVKDPAVFYVLPQGNHPAYDNQFCAQQSACFLRAIMKGKPYGGRYSGYEPSCQ
jgi:predicted esterase